MALWMAAHLVKPSMTISMENIMQMAVNKGYTAQGEMFSGTQKRTTVSVQNPTQKCFSVLECKVAFPW